MTLVHCVGERVGESVYGGERISTYQTSPLTTSGQKHPSILVGFSCPRRIDVVPTPLFEYIIIGGSYLHVIRSMEVKMHPHIFLVEGKKNYFISLTR